MAMFKKVLVLSMLAGLLAGCGASKKEVAAASAASESKGFTEGCAFMAHDLLDQQGVQINEDKLKAYCEEVAAKALKK